MKEFLILGPGCFNCKKLAENTEKAAKDLGIQYQLFKVSDITAITGFGVRRTPALAVDGKVVVQGRVPTPEELKTLLA
ncbi:MAG: TM0996/MTH895 family glutaredoxin-like protein [Acidobacteria bacterium]|nr:TM0996/MTH895 family glutaredoxin-like protein [Acidobacteriota bacterium]